MHDGDEDDLIEDKVISALRRAAAPYVMRGAVAAENNHGSTKGFEMSALICARAVSGTASQKQLLTLKEQKQVF